MHHPVINHREVEEVPYSVHISLSYALSQALTDCQTSPTLKIVNYSNSYWIRKNCNLDKASWDGLSITICRKIKDLFGFDVCKISSKKFQRKKFFVHIKFWLIITFWFFIKNGKTFENFKWSLKYLIRETKLY